MRQIPLDPNFPAVDSIFYDPGEVLIGIQVTIRNKHTVAILGLKHLQGQLKLKSLLALQALTTGNHWLLMFVVPAAAAASFKQQVFKQDTGRSEWTRKVGQYVPRIKKDKL